MAWLKSLFARTSALETNPFRAGITHRRRKVTLTHFFRDAALIVLGVFSAGFGLHSFLLVNHFIDGGATGISLLITHISHLPLGITLVLVNLPFILIGFKLMGPQFGWKTAAAILLLAIVATIVPYPVVTHDKLLVAVFGGFFLGSGIGLAVRGGAVLDGTEVLAIWLTRSTGLTMGDIILLFNILIFGFAAYLLTIETALYSILTYLSASKAVDFLVEGIEEYIGVTIVSGKHEQIRHFIVHDMGRGVTLYTGKRGFGKRGEREQEVDIIYTVLTRLEISRLRTEVAKFDPHAFVVMTSVKDAVGGILKKRPLKHP